MKAATIVFSFLILFSGSVFAQWQGENYLLNFEDPFTLSHLKIDSISNPDNIWKVGIPQKNNFNAAYSSPNVIVTALADPYPVNDTSAFIVSTTMTSVSIHEYMGIRGYYWVDSDTLSDYGKIEVSFDNSSTWINLMEDSIISNYQVPVEQL
ncbi:MAG: hypothetical protein ABIO46_00205 [Chitinophagales bacterium]